MTKGFLEDRIGGPKNTLVPISEKKWVQKAEDLGERNIQGQPKSSEPGGNIFFSKRTINGEGEAVGKGH